MMKTSIAIRVTFSVSLVIAISIAFTPRAHANFWDRLFGYDSYEECILDRLQGVNNNIVARDIREACRGMFPETRDSQNSPELFGEPVYLVRDSNSADILEADTTGGNLRLTIRNDSQHNWERVRIHFRSIPQENSCRDLQRADYISGPVGERLSGSLQSGQVAIVRFRNFFDLSPGLNCYFVYGEFYSIDGDLVDEM